MPIITRKNGYYPYEEVVFVGPDSSGVYIVDNSVLAEGLPEKLDPLQQEGVKDLLKDVEPLPTEQVELDYTEVKPESVEQVLRVTGLDLYRKKINLSKYGEGATTTGRPQPMPRPGEIHVYGRPVRQSDEYRRIREEGTVVRWEKYDRDAVRGKRER